MNSLCCLILAVSATLPTPIPTSGGQSNQGVPGPGLSLVERLDAVLQRPEYEQARWGILVQEADTGKTVYQRNADQLFAPASVTKLYSCAAALIALGADHRFETPVHLRGVVSGGTLDGDLILRASGDLTMGGRNKDGKMAFADDDHIYSSFTGENNQVTDSNVLAGLEDLARQVKASGITRVTGDVLIDTRLFEAARGSGSGPDMLSPILINDNLIDVIVRPAQEPGKPASSTLRPVTEFAQVDVRVQTVEKNKPTRITVRRVGPQRWTVRGTIAVGAKPRVRICPVDDPAGFARALFIEALRREGVEVSASALRPPTVELPEQASYNKLPRVAVHRSLPMSEALKVTLKVSHNLYASILPILVGLKHGKKTLAAGMREQGRLLEKLGVPVGSISLESGAGGGDGDRVSPRATVKLLQEMRKRPDWPIFEAALPILGVDGTLAQTVEQTSPSRGKVKGKTGTYTDDNLLLGRSHLRAKSLAGVMTTASGKELLFTIFVNDVPMTPGVTTSSVGKVIGKLCEILQQHNP